MLGTAKPKPSNRDINTKLDDQLDESFPASDPPSLTDPSKTIVPKEPVPAEEDDASTKPAEEG